MGAIAPRRQLQPFEEITVRKVNLTGTYYEPPSGTSPSNSTVNFEADLANHLTEPEASIWRVKYPSAADRTAFVMYGGVWRPIDTL